MYSKKKRQEIHADTRFFFFPQKISKMETKYTKKKSEQGHFFLFTQWRGEEKKNPGMETVEHTASTILVTQVVTKN